MESLDPTLYSVLQSLYQNNGRKSWNMYPENNGSICIKIRFNGRGIGSSESSIKQKSDSKIKRNMDRAKNWKENLDNKCEPKSAKRHRSEMSSDKSDSIKTIENFRNCEESCDDPLDLTLDQDLSSVGCTPIQTSSDLVSETETASLTHSLGRPQTGRHMDPPDISVPHQYSQLVGIRSPSVPSQGVDVCCSWSASSSMSMGGLP